MNVLILAAVLGQYGPPPVPRLPVATQPVASTYADALAQARRDGKPFVAFVGVPRRDVAGCVTVRTVGLPRGDRLMLRAIVVSPDGQAATWLDAGAGDQEIRQAAGLGVRRAATPFRRLLFGKDAVPRTADDRGRGISRAGIELLRKVWPDRLQFPQRFFRQERRYQNLWTENNGTFHGWRADDPSDHESADLLVSGGMVGIEGWTSIKALDVPAGKKISVWKEWVDVRALSRVPRWRWSFPTGVVAWDILVSDDGIFEIRRSEMGDDGWENKVTHKNPAHAPIGYVGPGSCASCHSKTAQVVSIPERIYQRVRWGDAGRFSWRPFLDDGQLDWSWPLERL